MDRAQLIQLHKRLILGESEPRERLSELLMRSVTALIKNQKPWADPSLIEEAVEDAILAYLSKPTTYDQNRSSLDTFICRTATNRLLSAYRACRRHHLKEHRALTGLAVLASQPRSEAPGAERQEFDLFSAEKTDEERRFLASWLSGAPVDALAGVLKTTEDGQLRKQAVKRMQERLRLRWKRHRRL